MNCHRCNKKISLSKIRKEFLCPHCQVEISTKYYYTALIIAFVFWLLIYSPLIMFFIDGVAMALLIDIFGGALLSLILINTLLLLGNKRKNFRNHDTE